MFVFKYIAFFVFVIWFERFFYSSYSYSFICFYILFIYIYFQAYSIVNYHCKITVHTMIIFLFVLCHLICAVVAINLKSGAHEVSVEVHEMIVVEEVEELVDRLMEIEGEKMKKM